MLINGPDASTATFLLGNLTVAACSLLSERRGDAEAMVHAIIGAMRGKDGSARDKGRRRARAWAKACGSWGGL
jgi:hypothetical protein